MKRKTVTLCLIARDNEKIIDATIKSALAVVDEIVVIDVGSNDKTVLVAQGYGAVVCSAKWENDFSKLRNAALAQATSDWILMLDPGDTLSPIRPVELNKLISVDGIAGYKVKLHDNDSNRWQVNLFRNHPFVKYRYPVYEKIEVELSAWAETRGLKIEESPLEITRTAEHNDTYFKKQNSKLLQSAMHLFPEAAYFPYQHGCKHIQIDGTSALPVSGLNKAVESFTQAWNLVKELPPEAYPTLDWLDDLVVKLVVGHLALNNYQTALEIVTSGLEMLPGNLLIRLWRGVSVVSVLESNPEMLPADLIIKLSDSARVDFRNCMKEPDYNNIRDGRMWRDLYASMWLGRLALNQKKYDEANAHFCRCLAVDNNYTEALVGLGICEEHEGNSRRALSCYMRAVNIDEMTPEAWCRGSKVLKELNFIDNAETWQAKAKQLFPEYYENYAVNQLQPA